MTNMLRKAGLIGLPLGLAALSLLVPAAAHDIVRLAGQLPLVKYACGARICQVYSHPPAERLTAPAGVPSVAWVQALCEKQVPLNDAGYKLRPRLVTRLQAPATQAAKMGGAASEHLVIYEFDLFYGNLPVSLSNRTVVVQDGRTVAIRDRNPPMGLQKPIGAPDVAYDAAWRLVYQNAGDTLARLYQAAPPRMMADTNPTTAPRLVLWPDLQEKKMHLAWNLTVRSASKGQPFIRRYWVAAQQPARILDFEDLVFYQAPPFPQRRPFAPVAPGLKPQGTQPVRTATATAAGFTAIFQGPITGTVTGAMWESSPYGSLVSRPLSGLTVTVARPGNIGQTVVTDTYGRYQATSVQGVATVEVKLSGYACRIVNDHAGKDDVLYSNRLGAVDANFAARQGEEYKLAQTSAYYHVTRAFEFVRDYLPERPAKVPGLTTRVNIDDSCNAYYDRSDVSLNFFRSSGKECPNTGYRDVVYHEYGHVVDDELGGVLDGPYSEGFGDALALLITRSPVVAQDFYGPGKHLRDSRNVVYYPMAKDGEVHKAGQVYAGFCWELTQQLQSSLGQERAYEVAKQLILGAAAQNPKDIPDAVRLSFFVDAQLYPQGKESQHAAQLRAAARSRQIPVPRNGRLLNSLAVN